MSANSASPADRPRLAVNLGHAQSLTTAAISKDRRLVLTGDTSGEALLWDFATGRQIRQLKGGTKAISSAAFSPDGRIVVTVSTNIACLWDVATGEELRRLEVDKSYIGPVAFSPDGRWILTGDAKTARLWDAATGREIRRFQADHVSSVAFSPDGESILMGDRDGILQLREVTTGNEVRRFQGHSGGISCAAFSPDGRFILTGSLYAVDNTARLWEVATGKEIHRFEVPPAGVDSVAFSPDGRFGLIVGRGETAILCDGMTGAEIRRFEKRSYLASADDFRPSSEFVLAENRPYLVLRDAMTGDEIQRFQGLSSNVWSAAFSPDGRSILTQSGDDTTRLWDTTTGQIIQQFERSRCGAISPDGRLVLVVDGTGKARLCDAITGSEVRRFEMPPGRITRAAFSPDGMFIAISYGIGFVCLWEAATGKRISSYMANPGDVYSITFSPDSRFILTGGKDNAARLYDTVEGTIRHFRGHSKPVLSAAFSPDGRLVLTGSLDGTTRLWDAATGKEIRRFQVSGWFVAFSPDGKLILVGFGHTAYLLDSTTGREIRQFQGHSQSINSAAFSPDGRSVLTGGYDNTTRLWDAATGREICHLISFRDRTWAVVDPEGRYDASNGGVVEGLHWVIGNEPIALYQLKQRYYDPGLLAKIMGFNKEPLRDVSAFKSVRLFPQVEYVAPARGSTKLTVRLTNRGGGIGRVRVLVNGKEITADARGPRPDPQAARAELSVDLAGAAIKEGQPNTIEVLAWNAEGYLSSRGAKLVWTPDGQPETKPPEVYAVVGGISTYSSSSINLRYAAKDAEDFAKALVLGSKRLFGADKVHLTVLTTSGNAGTIAPTKENFRKAFEAARKAKPEDLFIVYLAGHGVALRLSGDNDTYCYLAQEARSTDLTDPAVRAASSITSDEMVEWIKQVPALKQVMILDTCAAGAAASRLIENRNVSSDQVRAIERLKDRTGFHVLMGAAADKVSYETSQFSQGLLTYALLEGMKGAALLKDEFIDVSKLFQYAADRVPELARSIRVGGIQRPLIAAPRGTSFEIGQLGKEDKQQIPLARAKPLILRPVFISSDQGFDDLDLMSYVRKRLEEESYAAPRGQATAEVVFVEADELPGAIRPFGQYRVEGNRIRVTVNLVRDGQRLGSFVVESRKGDPAGLAASIVAKIAEALKSIR